jgi:hypothetical protein
VIERRRVTLRCHRYAHFARQISAGVFREIDRSRLPHWHEIDPYVLDKLVIADPGNRYGVPHAWGTTGLGVNVDLIRARVCATRPRSIRRAIRCNACTHRHRRRSTTSAGACAYGPS